MLYYTIYVKGLHNQTGYIDVALQDDQLLKDYILFLDIGLKSHKSYEVASFAAGKTKGGQFSIDLSCIAAITLNQPG